MWPGTFRLTYDMHIQVTLPSRVHLELAATDPGEQRQHNLWDYLIREQPHCIALYCIAVDKVVVVVGQT